MTRKPARAHIASDDATRPDTVPAALRFADESVPSSVFEAAGPRVLEPYAARPEILPPADEATVNYGPPGGFPPGDGRAQKHSPSHITKAPRSGTRNKQPSIETPVERRPHLHESDENEGARVYDRQRITASARQAARAPGSKLRLLVLAFLTAGTGGFIGVSLGNGSLQRTVERWFDSGGKHAPVNAPA
ncbi:MAG TPA: hypothetical protein VGK73_07605, partial [Polyangiaceae bacterium]